MTKDNRRVNSEVAQKRKLNREIQRMNDRLSKSRRNLTELYRYNILESEYRNIYAVSSIYGYLKKGRTKSLVFNDKTGDQGAYNIYENERRMNIIITNTEEIINRLDAVVQNQYDLAQGLRNAEKKINSMCSDINRFMDNTQSSLSSIQECQSIIAYNSARATRELEYLNWMHSIY